MIKVLFLCTGNSVRSQMAEAFLRTCGRGKFEAFSAGIEPKDIHPLTRRVMEEVGISVAQQRSKSVMEYMGQMHFGYLITVCDAAEKNCPRIFPGVSQRLHWSFEDPAALEADEETKLHKFREIRDRIRERVETWAAQTLANSA